MPLSNKTVIAGTGNIKQITNNGTVSLYPLKYATTQTVLSIFPASFSFGNIFGGTESKTESFVILNVNSNQAVTGITESITNESYFMIINQSQPNSCGTLDGDVLNGGESCIITVRFMSIESVVSNIFESSELLVGYVPYTGAQPLTPANGSKSMLSGTILNPNSPNIITKFITLSPDALIGNGSQSPNQWQILLDTSPLSMTISYVNIGFTNADNFTVLTNSLSLGYTIESNSCLGVVLESNESSVCSVILNVNTSNLGEEDLSLTPLTFSFIGQSLQQPTVWLNQFTLINQESVFVEISESVITEQSPAVFGSAGVTNAVTGTIVRGDVDTTSTLGSITGFPPGLITGSFYANGSAEANAAYTQAYTEFTSAGTLLPACLATGVPPVGHNLTGLDLGSVGPLTGGVYCFSSSAGLTGNLVLSGGPLATYTFLVTSTLTTASNSNVILTNGTSYRNVFWYIGSAGTFGTQTSFAGIIAAQAAITDNGGSSFLGNLWVLTGPVSLNNTSVTP